MNDKGQKRNKTAESSDRNVAAFLGKETPMRKTAYQMRELAACALHGKVPSQELLAQVDPEKLYIMCQFHCLTAMVAVALRSAGIRSPQWEEEHVKAVRKSILLAAERRKLCEFLEIGMRQMADNDILYDKTARDKVRTFLTANGYQAISFGKSHHDVYQKPPVYHFEMHVSLYPAGREKRIEAYNANPEPTSTPLAAEPDCVPCWTSMSICSRKVKCWTGHISQQNCVSLDCQNLNSRCGS